TGLRFLPRSISSTSSPISIASHGSSPRLMILILRARGGFLLFPIGDRRCNRTRASVGNAGGNARPSLTNATLAASRLLARNLGLEVDKLEIRRAEDIVTAVEPLKSEEASPGTTVSNICSASYN